MAENSGGGGTTFDGINFATGVINYGDIYGGFGAGAGVDLNRTGTYSTGVTATNLTGLTSGQQYRIQALVYDGRGPQTGRTLEIDGATMGTYANGINGTSWGPGLLMTGTFTADATTEQSFTIETLETTGASSGSQLNAITLYTVPEPSSAALLGLGGLALILRRRK